MSEETPATPELFALTDVERIDMLTKQLATMNERFDELEARYRAANNTITDFTDSRLDHLWETAGGIADRKGYCDVFDTILNELGAEWQRTVEICVTVEQTRSYDVHVTIPRNDMYESTVRDAVEAELGSRDDDLDASLDVMHTGEWQIADWQEADV